MIGKLTGIIDSTEEGHLILDVNGVGYLVQASTRTLNKIGNKGDPTSILIQTQVREDSITLFGFADALEQEWFKLLTSVQGVGAKAGLSIIATCAPERLALIIASADKAAIQSANGVGPKLATRVVTELKDKAGKMDLSPKPVGTSVDTPADNSPTPQNTGLEGDAVSALLNLGYGRADAYQAVMKARNDNDDLQDIIRAALQELSA